MGTHTGRSSSHTQKNTRAHKLSSGVTETSQESASKHKEGATVLLNAEVSKSEQRVRVFTERDIAYKSNLSAVSINYPSNDERERDLGPADE